MDATSDWGMKDHMHEDQLSGFDLSPQQRHLWSLLRESGEEAFRCHGTVAVHGALDAGVLRRALERLVERHEILRMSFRCLPGMSVPLQVVATGASFALIERDLRELEPERRATAAGELFRSLAAEPFVLENGPVLRAGIAVLGETERLVWLGLPALCADRATFRELVRELAACCDELATGCEPGEPPLQYPDVAAWQNDLLQAKDREVGRAWWRAQTPLAAFGGLRLACEREETAAAFVPATVDRWIDAELLGRLERIAGELGSTLQNLLQAAWTVLLSRLVENGEPIVARDYDGRRYDELVGSLGPLARFLPLQVSPREGETFAGFLDRLTALAREAGAWQEYFSWKEGQFPLFVFTLHEQPALVVAGGVSWLLEDLVVRNERFRLALSCERRDGGLAALLFYDTGRFGRGDVLLLGEQFLRLLLAAAEAPSTRLEELPALGIAEAHRLIVELNDTQAAESREVPFLRQLAAQAERHPARVAAVAAGEEITYGDLLLRVRQLAAFLRRLGVGPEVRVGLCVERSLDTLIGLLGTLAAGGAFVPMDRSYPAERLAWILADARVSVVLTHRGLASRLPLHLARVVFLDTQREEIARSGEDPPVDLDSSHLAYVIYTSGSTGRPKGVMITHRGLSNYLAWCREAYFCGDGRGCPVHSPIGFDLTITSLLAPLLEGRTVELLPEEPGVDTLAALLSSGAEYDFVKLTPSHLQLLDKLVPAERAAGAARAFVVGGEALRGETVAFWREHAPGTCLFNEYGPTEAAVGCCVYEVPPEVELPACVPIGRPIPNVRLFVLDQSGSVTPSQLAGELCIAGVGLARGYLGRPDLTAERFIPDFLSGVPGGRLYRTGDLVRYQSSGNLDFLGRIDRQVKIRGFRIEPGEIEAALVLHPAVADAAVLVDRDVSRHEALVAFYLPVAGARAVAGELRELLRASLPEHMVPASIVPVDTMPLTPTGKVDREALLATARVASGTAAVSGPGTPAEEILAGIWSDLLRVERITPGDSFFAIGGHSLMATQLLSRIRKVFQVDLPMRALFDAPTLSGMAEGIASARSGSQGREELPIVPVPREGRLPLSFAQRRLWFLDQLEPGSAAYVVPTAVRLAGRVDEGALERSVSELVRRHESLRTTFPTDLGEPIQEIAAPIAVKLPILDLSEIPRAASAARSIARAEAEQPFDLERGPLWRVRLLRLDEDDHVFLFTTHHIVSDAWSKGVLLSEIGALYQAFASGRPSPLPELPVQYADFVHWQRAWLQGQVLERQIAHWRDHLAGAPPVLALPTDLPRPPLATLRGAYQALAFSDELSASLRALARREGVTMFMTLLAAFEVVLSCFAGQEDFVVGANIANRNRAEVEGLIGFFVNLLPLRADLTGDPAFRELLSRVRETSLGAYAHQDVPFEVLVQELKIEREAGRPPLVQVVFTFQTAPPGLPELPGLAVTAFNEGNDSVKFDLVLVASEHGDRLSCALMYKTDLFYTPTIVQLLRQLEICLGTVVRDPEIRVSALAALFAEEGKRQAGEAREKFNKFRLGRSRGLRPKPVRANVLEGEN